MIFVNSMSDLFHQRVPASYVDRVLDTVRKTPRHTYQVLTKRPGKMASVMRRLQPEPLPNLWLGTSVEDDPEVGRVDHVRRTPAAVRFLSLEPLLGPVPSLDLAGVDWVIVGGESGPRHRPIDPSWVRAIRDRCLSEGVAFFFKQWGGRTPKAGGRELDGRTWDEMPAATRTAVPA